MIAWKASSSQTSKLDESNGDVLPQENLNQQLRGSLIRLANALQKPERKPGGGQWRPFIIAGEVGDQQAEIGSKWVQFVNATKVRSTAQNTPKRSISTVEAGIITFEIFHETLHENPTTSR